ncbi:double-stranded rna-binding protein 1-like isoform x1 [Hordeum vulgare]|nr:double-stranded rna-binding protein 1-like isoform x1 [Hordeum vulgare]
MNKVNLNKLCQQRRWAAPAYTDRREGPEHASRFHATVAVGGAEFSSPASAGSRTLLQAQDLAARAALEHLPAPPPQPLPATAMPGACAKCGCSKTTDQIKVYRRHPEMVLPDGATILPFSDDDWVAVRLPSPQP